MFDQERFIEDCRAAVSGGQVALREVVERTVSSPRDVLAGLGEPEAAEVNTLYRAPDLTIINFVWAPHMSLMPHDHQMFALIGLYAGREDNVFWRRGQERIEAAGAKSLGAGEVATLGTHIIHSVLNPLGKMSCALHVYGGDFFEPERPRSEWDHETLTEHPWEIERVRAVFREADARAKAVV